jgi:hypothetical protein
VLQAKARLNYCFLFKITLLWQLRFISKSEKEPPRVSQILPEFTIWFIGSTAADAAVTSRAFGPQ